MLRTITASSRRRRTYDTDAALWIAAVEAADASLLENSVTAAMDDLVLAMKAASIWTPTSTMVVKMSARTIAGALIDIKNPASSWINVNFTSGDYNRTTGLVGNGTTKYLSSERNNNADGQNDHSMWTRVTTPATTFGMCYMGAGLLTDVGCTGFRVAATTSAVNFNSRANSADTDTGANAANLIGMWRQSDSSSFVSVGNDSSQGFTRTSQTPFNANVFEYAANNGSPTGHSDHRSCAAGIGAYMNLFTVQTAINNYISAITALGL